MFVAAILGTVGCSAYRDMSLAALQLTYHLLSSLSRSGHIYPVASLEMLITMFAKMVVHTGGDKLHPTGLTFPSLSLLHGLSFSSRRS